MAAAIDKVGKESDETAKKLTKSERAARRIQESVDPQKRYNRQLEQTALLVRKGALGMDDAQRKAQQLRSRLDRVGAAGKSAGRSIKDIAIGLTGGFGILRAVSQVNAAYDVWLQNIREISAESKKAQDQMIAFAALQAGGTKAERVERAAALGTRFGVQDRGEAFNTVQAMQSALSEGVTEEQAFELGMKSAATIFAASQVGIPVALGRELEVLGASQGQAPGQAIRRAFVAGQASSRTPEAIAKAAPALKNFDDKDFGFAVAAVLAGGDTEKAVKVLTERAGIGLSQVGSAQAKFEELGLGKATRQERLQKLAELGVDTPVELKEFGFTELRTIKALSTLVPQIARIGTIADKIKEGATPGLFAAQRGAIETELPNQKTAREIDILRSTYKDDQALGEEARGALNVEREQLIRGIALSRTGQKSFLGFDLVDETGRVNEKSELFFNIVGRTIEEWVALNKEIAIIRSGLDNEVTPQNVSELKDIAESTKRTADAAEADGPAQSARQQ